MKYNIKNMGLGLLSLFISFIIYLFTHKGNMCWINCEEKNHDIINN